MTIVEGVVRYRRGDLVDYVVDHIVVNCHWAWHIVLLVTASCGRETFYRVLVTSRNVDHFLATALECLEGKWLRLLCPVTD